MFKDVLKLYPEEPLFSSPFANTKGVVSYDTKIEEMPQNINDYLNI